MKLTQLSPKLRYHPDAYRFVFEALQFMQDKLCKPKTEDADDESAHITGPQLLEGIRELGLQKFGLMTRSVFQHWGVSCTEDFGRIVFELVDRGEMRKTDQDRISDFYEIYSFQDVFDHTYEISTQAAFS